MAHLSSRETQVLVRADRAEEEMMNSTERQAQIRRTSNRLSVTKIGSSQDLHAHEWSIEEEVSARTDAQGVLEALHFFESEIRATLTRFGAKLSNFLAAQKALDTREQQPEQEVDLR